ncbi:nickel transporter [Clostridiales bacterium PH28_bin88]|nr:nickel transporter [Clostridiales bacterium PH28_bin88]
MGTSFQWNFVREILPQLLRASVVTVELTVLAIAIGLVIGLVVTLARMSRFKPLAWLAVSYVEFFRGTPLLVQIFIIHYAVSDIFGYTPVPFISAFAALGVNSGAYIAEIFRGGIQAIDRGQMEAARSLGMRWGQAMRYIILPQAFKVSVPALGNEFIALLKDSSLVTVISVIELMTQGRMIVGARPRYTEVWFTVAIIYLLMTRTISLLVNRLERRLKTGDHSEKSL